MGLVFLLKSHSKVSSNVNFKACSITRKHRTHVQTQGNYMCRKESIGEVRVKKHVNVDMH